MANLVEQIKDAIDAEVRTQTGLTTTDRLRKFFDIEQSDRRTIRNGYAVRPLAASTSDGIIKNYTLSQEFEVILTKAIPRQADDVDRVHVVARAVALPPDREMLHAIPQEYRVDRQRGIKDPLGMAGVRLEAEVFLVTCAITASANIRKAVNRAGYRVQELVLEPLAGARAVLTEDEKEVGVAMVEIGASTTDLAVYYEGKVQHVAILPFGGNTLTADLVRGLSVPYAEAQKAKEHYGTAFAQLVDPRETVEMPGPSPGQRRAVARELIAHIVEQRLDEMFSLVQGELQDHALLDKLGAGVVLTGGTVAIPGILELSQQIFASPVRLGVPSEGLSGLADSVGRPRFAIATGLALWGADRFAETGRGASTITSGMLTKLGTWLKEFF